MFVAVLAGVISCKKDATSRSSGFLGKWELRGLSGGIGGYVYDYRAGAGNYYDFKADNTYDLHQSDISNVATGTYRLKFEDKKDGCSQGKLTFIETQHTTNAYLRADTLILDDEFPDGFRARYIRMK